MSTVPSSQEEAELKGGHPPAVKVAGGVRITQHKQPQEGEPKTKEELEEERRQQQIATAAAHEQRLLLAGAPTKGDKDFTTEAVKSFHEKPLPTVQQPHVSVPVSLQQPRKN